MLAPEVVNKSCPLDFVLDSFTDELHMRISAIVDSYSRECLGLVADKSISGMRVAGELLWNWKVGYNHIRPHSVLGNLATTELASNINFEKYDA